VANPIPDAEGVCDRLVFAVDSSPEAALHMLAPNQLVHSSTLERGMHVEAKLSIGNLGK